MGWKDWPYWLKGGTIFSLVFSIFYLIFFGINLTSSLGGLSENNTGSFSLGPFLWSLLYLLFRGIDALFYNIFIRSDFQYNVCRWFSSCATHYQSVLTDFFIVLIIYFIIGAVIGWIYGKIKSK